ncbi:unnamed protein product [marine sediment metagenome]|uniref:Glutamate racemase n=1 Tax=marine sediment metagenome TaxID=412755 RepID=X1I4P0_9ZZZZ
MNSRSESESARIAVFDSGVGGLTVVSEIMKLLPGQAHKECSSDES